MARMGMRRGDHGGLGGGNLKQRDQFEDLGVDGRTILKRIFTDKLHLFCPTQHMFIY